MNSGRQVGVRIPQNQSTEQAPVMTVTQVAVGTPLLVEYGDERGLKHTTIAFRFGDKVFIPPQGEAWTEGHKPFAKDINDQILAKVESSKPSGTVSVPTDAVDVTGLGGDLTDEQTEAVENGLRKG